MSNNKIDADKTFSAIILAAGKGSRIGKSKALLEIGDSTFLNSIHQKIKSTIPECRIVCVINSEVEKHIKNKNYNYIVNKELNKGMSHSIYIGLESVQKSDYYLIFPVDHPIIKESSIIEMLKNLDPTKVTIPIFNERKGHPIIVPRILKEKFRTKLNTPLNILIKEENKILVPVIDSGIITNVNTKEDLERINNER